MRTGSWLPRIGLSPSRRVAASILTLSVVVVAAFASFAGSTTYTLDRSDALPATMQLRDLGLATSDVFYTDDAANA